MACFAWFPLQLTHLVPRFSSNEPLHEYTADIIENVVRRGMVNDHEFFVAMIFHDFFCLETVFTVLESASVATP